MRKSYLLLASAALGLALSSCGGSSDAPDYFPVQEDKDGNWGMVSPDGKLLFSAEFKNEPTYAYNDRFMVKNADGLWEIYTADAEPQKVGKEYKQAGLFYENVAPVVEKGKNIDFIDRDGNVKFTLDKVDGKPVVSVTNFEDGLAIFRVDDYYGCINTSGEVVVKPDYTNISYHGDGKMFAKHKKYAEMEEGAVAKISVLDKKGNVLFEFSEDKYSPSTPFEDGQAVVYQYEDGESRYGIIDEKGEWVVKPSAKVRGIVDKKGKNFVFYDGESYGLMNTEGETLLRAKYDALFFLSNDLLVAESKKEQSIIDLEGNPVGKNAYERITPCRDGKHAIAKESKDSYLLIDLEGNPVDKKQSFYDFGGSYGDGTIESDFVDIPAAVSSVVEESGLLGLSDKSTVDQVLEAASVEDYNYWSYTRQTDVEGNTEKAGNSISFVCFYMEPPLKMNRGEYERKAIHPFAIAAKYPGWGKLSDKAADIYKQIEAGLKAKNGHVTLQTEDEVVYEFDAYTFLVSKHSQAAVAIIYKNEKTEPYMEKLVDRMLQWMK